MERYHPSDVVLAVCTRRPPHPTPRISRGSRGLHRRHRSALAGILASAALVSAACSANHHPVSPAPAAGSFARGTASWYGPKFDGHRTASGERYDMRKLTAAHPNLPFGTLVQVTNLENGRQVVVRINDRGPFGRRRIIDLSYAAARELAMVGPGTAHVELALLGRYEPPIPAGPPVPLIQIAQAPLPADRDPAASLPGAPVPDSAQPGAAGEAGGTPRGGDRDAPVDRPALANAAAAGTPGSEKTLHFTVQVGAFGEVERAAELQQDLARRYPAAAVLSDGTWNRVQVGLFDDRERAEELRRELQSAGLAAIVVAAR